MFSTKSMIFVDLAAIYQDITSFESIICQKSTFCGIFDWFGLLLHPANRQLHYTSIYPNLSTRIEAMS